MSHLFAYLSRMKLITRWPLMHNVRIENVQEHSLQVAMIAHGLALIENCNFDGNYDAYKVAVIALFHDASEVFTGDMPTPVKYFNKNIESEYKKIESVANERLLSMVPNELNLAYREVIDGQCLSDAEQKLVKAADTLSAYLKCIEEIRFGNHEFEPAYKRLKRLISQHELSSVHYFVESYIPSFHMSFDEMNREL